MKRVALVVMGVVLSFSVNAQKIKTDKVDDFSGKRIIETDWMLVYAKLFNSFYFSFKSVEQIKCLKIEWVHPEDIRAVNDGENIVIIKLTNGEVVNFANSSFQVSSKGGGAHGFGSSAANGLTLTLMSFDIDKLGMFLIEKVRIVTTKGYFDFEIKEKNAKKIQQAYLLLQESLKQSN